MDQIYDCIIIGGGIAGITASIYLGMARKKSQILCLTGGNSGGLLNTTDFVDNYPGFFNISGPELCKNFVNHAKQYAILDEDYIYDVDFSNPIKKLIGYSNTYFTKSVLIATGSIPKKLPQLEQNYLNLSYCAICDGFLCKENEIIVVIGGGNSAVESALYLAPKCKKLYLISRSEKLRAFSYLIENLSNFSNIEIIYNANLSTTNIEDDRITVLTFDTGLSLKIDRLFINIGHKPNTDFLKNSEINLNSEGNILVNINTYQSNLSGIFAAGDVIDHGFTRYKQAIIAGAEAAHAALEINNYLN